jgi:hypothetical protein
MTPEIYEKTIIAFIGAIIAMFLKLIIDYVYRKIKIENLKKILIADLIHQLETSMVFNIETKKLYEIYSNGLKNLKNFHFLDFYQELRKTIFKEVFFSRQTFDTFNKVELLLILKKNPKAFGETHNIYNIVDKLKNINTVYYEELFDEHIKAYMENINKNDRVIVIERLEMALNFITIKINSDVKNTIVLINLIYEYLIKLIGSEDQLKKIYKIEMIKL